VPILLDTCAVIWVAQGEGLSKAAQAELAAELNQNREIYVSPITAWEIGILAARGRLALRMRPVAWFNEFLRLPGITLAPMPPDVLIASSHLPGGPPNDPADRIIVATAREYGYRLMTRDGKIAGYASEGHLDVSLC
jgi:PIN domain nuclease of toxin-antitoxin system